MDKKIFEKDKKKILEEQRIKDVKLYGFNNTRGNKRKIQKLEKDINQTFINITEVWVNKYIEVNFDEENKELLSIYEKSEKKWKGFARLLIGKHTDFFNTSPKRKRLLSKFEDFILNLINNNKE